MHNQPPTPYAPAYAPRKPGLFSRHRLLILLAAAVLALVLFYSRTIQGMM